ncbi:MAG: hypothetical protein K2Y22_02265 [Candidatus Obscuribacterales bacterium]|nr:hypothetical protein [Candidatus Obscuribacterales bacterium]
MADGIRELQHQDELYNHLVGPAKIEKTTGFDGFVNDFWRGMEDNVLPGKFIKDTTRPVAEAIGMTYDDAVLSYSKWSQRPELIAQHAAQLHREARTETAYGDNMAAWSVMHRELRFLRKGFGNESQSLTTQAVALDKGRLGIRIMAATGLVPPGLRVTADSVADADNLKANPDQLKDYQF